MDYIQEKRLMQLAVHVTSLSSADKLRAIESTLVRLKQPVIIRQPFSMAAKKYIVYGSLPFAIVGPNDADTDKIIQNEYTKLKKMWDINFNKIAEIKYDDTIADVLPILPTGNLNAKYMIIGNERLLDRKYEYSYCSYTQGATSEYLRLCLLRAKVLDDCWFTSYHKLPLMAKRVATPEELELNYSYIHQEIELVKPKNIIILGSSIKSEFDKTFPRILQENFTLESVSTIITPTSAILKNMRVKKYAAMIRLSLFGDE